MADVDFSNAIIEPYVGNDPYALKDAWLKMKGFTGDPKLTDANGQIIVSRIQQYDLNGETTITHFAIREEGEFNASGTEFYLGFYSYNTGRVYVYWKISNISFSSGDTFDFKVEIDLSIV